MDTEIYIGSERLDCSDDIVTVFSNGDIREINSGRISSSYNISVPLTPRNRRLLSYNEELNCFSEVTERGYIYTKGVLVLKGKVLVLSSKLPEYAEIIIQGTGWMDHFMDKRLRDLDLSAHDHEYNATNVESSWSGAAKFYRYPMIWFAKLFSGQEGSSAMWLTNDFLPMFRIVDLLTEIFKPFTIAGQFLTNAAELYILGKEQLAEASYIQNKDMRVMIASSADNEISDTIPAGGTKMILYPEAIVDFNTIIDNDQTLFSTTTNKYTVKDTGTHRFTFIVEPDWVATDKATLTISYQALVIRIYRTRGASTIKIYERFYYYSSSDILHGTVYTADTWYMRFEANDEVYGTVEMAQTLTSSYGGIQDVDMHLEAATEFKLTWNNRCLNLGLLSLISAEEMLPDVSQVDFVKAIKEIFNLKFTPDYMRQIVYIESLDDTFTNNVRELNRLNFDTMESENISSNYSSVIRLKLKLDTNDKAVTNYLLSHSEPYLKEIILTSEYTRKEIETLENSLFAYSQLGDMYYASAPITTPRIWGSEEYPAGQYYPEYRTNNFIPRILWWNGLTSGITWNFNGVSKSTWPKSSTVDMSAVFTQSWIKSMRLVDKGKILKVEAVVSPTFLQEFMTIINDINQEGFRAIYEFRKGNSIYHGYLNKVEFKNETALLELLIKH